MMIVWRAPIESIVNPKGEVIGVRLPIKKKYFDLIKSGKKKVEYRDAHITFVCEETGKELKKDIRLVGMIPKRYLSKKLRDSDMFEDDILIWFEFSKP